LGESVGIREALEFALQLHRRDITSKEACRSTIPVAQSKYFCLFPMSLLRLAFLGITIDLLLSLNQRAVVAADREIVFAGCHGLGYG
jgi:hypothetical protein